MPVGPSRSAWATRFGSSPPEGGTPSRSRAAKELESWLQDSPHPNFGCRLPDPSRRLSATGRARGRRRRARAPPRAGDRALDSLVREAFEDLRQVFRIGEHPGRWLGGWARRGDREESFPPNPVCVGRSEHAAAMGLQDPVKSPRYYRFALPWV